METISDDKSTNLISLLRREQTTSTEDLLLGEEPLQVTTTKPINNLQDNSSQTSPQASTISDIDLLAVSGSSNNNVLINQKKVESEEEAMKDIQLNGSQNSDTLE